MRVRGLVRVIEQTQTDRAFLIDQRWPGLDASAGLDGSGQLIEVPLSNAVPVPVRTLPIHEAAPGACPETFLQSGQVAAHGQRLPAGVMDHKSQTQVIRQQLLIEVAR